MRVPPPDESPGARSDAPRERLHTFGSGTGPGNNPALDQTARRHERRSRPGLALRAPPRASDRARPGPEIGAGVSESDDRCSFRPVHSRVTPHRCLSLVFVCTGERGQLLGRARQDTINELPGPLFILFRDEEGTPASLGHEESVVRRLFIGPETNGDALLLQGLEQKIRLEAIADRV